MNIREPVFRTMSSHISRWPLLLSESAGFIGVELLLFLFQLAVGEILASLKSVVVKDVQFAANETELPLVVGSFNI